MTDNPTFPKLLKAPDVAKILNVSRTQAYRLMQEGQIQTVKFGSCVRCTLADIEYFIETHRGQG